MRSALIISLAAVASAQNFKVPNLHFTPGTDKVLDPECITTPEGNDCPAKLPSGNIIVHAWHQVIDESTPDKDVNAASNAASVGAHFKTLKEVRTLAIFPGFPESGKGKQCKMHFFTNNGANPAYQYVSKLAVWSLKPGKNSNMETVWHNKPDRASKVALFDYAAPANKDVPGKFDHISIEGPAYPSDKTFPCPTPGQHIAWELSMDTPKSTWNDSTPDRMFAGGQNGFAIEIMDAKQTAYGPVPSPAGGSSCTPKTVTVTQTMLPSGTACNAPTKPTVTKPVVSGTGWHVGGPINSTNVAPKPPIQSQFQGAASAIQPALSGMGIAAMVMYAFL